jgi:hypothetical protein
MPMLFGMRILSSPEARSFIQGKGGLLFVWAVSGMRRIRVLRVSTEPPPDALDWRRVEANGFLLFLPPQMRSPRELHLEVRGVLRRRVQAFWNGCAYVI